MSLITRELREVWDALRAGAGHRDDALTEVRIRKLRGIWDLRLPFEYPVAVLAGPNGCGKSTVLFACACACDVPAPGRLHPHRLRSDSSHAGRRPYRHAVVVVYTTRTSPAWGSGHRPRACGFRRRAGARNRCAVRRIPEAAS